MAFTGNEPPAPVAPLCEDVADSSKVHRTVIEHARAAASKEQSMTLLQGLKLYPKAVAWSLLISTCIVMEGYDISLVNNFCARLPLRNALGTRVARVNALVRGGEPRLTREQTPFPSSSASTAYNCQTAPTKSLPPGKQA